MRVVLCFCALALLACTETGTPIDHFDESSIDATYDVDFWDLSAPCAQQSGESWPSARKTVFPLEIDRRADSMILAFDKRVYLETPLPGDAVLQWAGTVYVDDPREGIIPLEGAIYAQIGPGHAHGTLEIDFSGRTSGCLRTFEIHGDIRPAP